jgi:hypothetical protein
MCMFVIVLDYVYILCPCMFVIVLDVNTCDLLLCPCMFVIVLDYVNTCAKERNRDLTILNEGVISLFHFISSKNVTCNSSKKFKRIPRHFACLVITIWRLTYRYSNLIESFLKELLPLSLHKSRSHVFT